MSGNCYYHPDMQSAGICAGCGKALCHECAVRRDNEVFCMEECRRAFLKQKRKEIRRRRMPLIILLLIFLIVCIGIVVGLFVYDYIEEHKDIGPKILLDSKGRPVSGIIMTYRHRDNLSFSEKWDRQPDWFKFFMIVCVAGTVMYMIVFIVKIASPNPNIIPISISEKKKGLERNKAANTNRLFDYQSTAMGSNENTTPVKENRIKCPYCSEMIAYDAEKCRFCGEWLNKTKS